MQRCGFDPPLRIIFPVEGIFPIELPIEVFTFRLHGWCMLDVFLLPSFTSLEHECQDLLRPCNGMHV